MNEPQAPDGPRRGLAGEDQESAPATDPLTRDEPAGGGSDVPVELEAVVERRPAPHETLPKERGELREAFDVNDDDLPVGWETGYGADDYDEEPEFGAGYDEESVFGPGEDPGPRLAPGPKHRPGPHHEHGPGPHKAPGKKAPGKKAPGPKKHPGHRPGPPHEHGPGPEKAPGPKKHPGHRPGPPHEYGRECDPGGPEPEPGFEFGPSGGWGSGPRPDFGFGPGGVRDRRRGAGRRGRPGDVRAAILALLAERPMHGYEMIQEIAERSQDLWRPSPGSVYPTLQLLDDEGLIVGTQTEGSKKLFELTDQGRAGAQKITTPPWEKIAEGADTGQVDLRTALAQLVGAVTQSAYGVAAEHQRRIVAILKKARREIYGLLAEAE
jgi:DNA-binding PadR family transcriptional regulator